MIFGGTLSQPFDFSKTTVWKNHEGQRERGKLRVDLESLGEWTVENKSR
jgi:hypothetical protein